MAPKKGKGKAAAPAAAPKSLSTRVRQVAAEQQQHADEAQQTAPEQQELIVPIQMAFTSLLTLMDAPSRSSAFVMVENPATSTPLWRDSFSVGWDSSWLLPPLHKYLGPEDADHPAEQLLVQFWQEHRFRERLRLGQRLLAEFGDVTGAAMVLFDIAPGHFAADWATRVRMACAAYKHAWLSSGEPSIRGLQVQDGSLTLADVRWLRAQWLLARTLCGAWYQTGMRTGGLLGMVLSALVGSAPEDPLGTRFMLQRLLTGQASWSNILEATAAVQPRPTHFSQLPHNTYGLDSASMATAYNRALACYNCYGPGDPDTEAALAAAFERDSAHWVPLLLAGGALAVPVTSPLVALGSKEEASAYCREYGTWWWMGCFDHDSLVAVIDDEDVLEQPDSVGWLLQAAGLDELYGLEAGRSHTGIIMFNLWLFHWAMSCSLPAVVEEMNVRINGSMAVGTVGSTQPHTCPDIARACLVLLSCLSSSSQNRPPPDTCALSLWGPASKLFSIDLRSDNAVAQLKSRLSDSATAVFDIAQRLLAQCRTWQQQARRQELQGDLDLLWSAELLHWDRTLEELRPARVRLFWQAGQVRAAKDAAAQLLQEQQQLQARLQAQLSSPALQARDAALTQLLRGSAASPGPVLHSLPALQQMQEFVNQQALEAARRTLSSRTRGGGARGTGSSSSGHTTGEVQFGRYDEATPEALQAYAAAVVDAVGGAAGIDAALDKAGLLQAYGNRGAHSSSGSSSSADDGDSEGGDESEEEEDDASEWQGRRKAEQGIAVIEALMGAPVHPLPVRQGAAGGQQQQQGAGSSSSSSTGGSGGPQPRFTAALRASLRNSDLPWLASSGDSGSGGLRPTPEMIDRVFEAMINPDAVEAALASLPPAQKAAMEGFLDRLMGELGIDDAAGGSGGSSGIGSSERLGNAVLAASQQAAAGAAAGTGPAVQSGAGVGSGSGGSAGPGWDPSRGSAGGAFKAADPGPGFVFGSSPDAAAAAATAAFDAVLQSYSAPAAAGGPSSSSSGAGRVTSPNPPATAGGVPSPPGSTSPAARGAAAAAAGAGSPAAAMAGSSPAAAGGRAQAAAAEEPDGTAVGKVCACCGGTFPKVFRCSGCAAVGLVMGYCSAGCQKAHWKAGHKSVCGAKAQGA